jgi:DNA recombination protein Rad52
MSGFSAKQQRALHRKLDRRHVRSRDVDGRSIDYIEGWFAIAEANAIFGFDGWDREMTHFERLYERTRNDRVCCGYMARVRVRVRAGDAFILREGTGWGSATSNHHADAHERALKAAETDGTKRALATFGNRFGLGLYDKEQIGVTAKKIQTPSGRTLFDPTGLPFADNLSPESFCSALRQLVEKINEPAELEALERWNRDGIAALRTDAPHLKTARDIHYADILERLIKDRLKSTQGSLSTEEATIALPPPALLKPSRIANGPRIDKSELAIGTERRLRDKAHLQFVAAHPCLICARQPCHGHHLTFAQKRGLSMKVSDEFVVPLCAIHHDELHRFGAERDWWHSQGVDPEPIAATLWSQSHGSGVPLHSDVVDMNETNPAAPSSKPLPEPRQLSAPAAQT